MDTRIVIGSFTAAGLLGKPVMPDMQQIGKLFLCSNDKIRMRGMMEQIYADYFAPADRGVATPKLCRRPSDDAIYLRVWDDDSSIAEAEEYNKTNRVPCEHHINAKDVMAVRNTLKRIQNEYEYRIQDETKIIEPLFVLIDDIADLIHAVGREKTKKFLQQFGMYGNYQSAHIYLVIGISIETLMSFGQNDMLGPRVGSIAIMCDRVSPGMAKRISEYFGPYVGEMITHGGRAFNEGLLIDFQSAPLAFMVEQAYMWHDSQPLYKPNRDKESARFFKQVLTAINKKH